MDMHQLLKFAFEHKGSDLHITVNSSPMLRLNGQLRKIGNHDLTPEMTKEMAKAIATEQQYKEFEQKGEADFAYALEDVCRFRVNLFKQKNSVAIVCRVINSSPPSVKDLKISDVIRSFVHKHQGLLLVTGPTGSGKSTTLAALINYINEEMNRHIITLEDPIEYIHPHKKSIVNQREIGQDSYSFASALRASLRQDPDVILVGEMRDLETIHIAVTAAETGHLVLATLHTTSAPQTIDRIIDVFPGNQQQQIRTQLAGVLVGVVTQTLLPTADKQGRVAAHEILVNTPAVANLIRSDKIHQIRNLMETGKSHGMQTMDMAVRQLLQNGVIDKSVAEAILVKQDF
jgi:twitching motility protein PilT